MESCCKSNTLRQRTHIFVNSISIYLLIFKTNYAQYNNIVRMSVASAGNELCGGPSLQRLEIKTPVTIILIVELHPVQLTIQIPILDFDTKEKVVPTGHYSIPAMAILTVPTRQAGPASNCTGSWRPPHGITKHHCYRQ